jgi:hypothetical protein
MNALVRRGRAWAPSVKAAALFVLPLPLLVAILSALIAGDVLRFALAGWALGCFWGAGLLVLRALAAEARYFLGERADPPAVPLKLFSASLRARGCAGRHGRRTHARRRAPVRRAWRRGTCCILRT